MNDATRNLLMRLRRLLSYDPETGEFSRLPVPGRGHSASRRVGGLNHDGYHSIGVDGRHFLAHRLAWLFATGSWPARSIDHIDGNPRNNRFSNLRDVEHALNMQNLKAAKRTSKTGFLGVSFVRRAGAYSARITVNRRQIYLGTFPSAELAHERYLSAKRVLHAGGTL